MTLPVSSSSDAEQADSLFKSSSEATKHYQDLVAKLIEDEESDSSSLSDPEDFQPYYAFWNLPQPKPPEDK